MYDMVYIQVVIMQPWLYVEMDKKSNAEIEKKAEVSPPPPHIHNLICSCIGLSMGHVASM
jgi:hypothetical protein